MRRVVDLNPRILLAALLVVLAALVTFGIVQWVRHDNAAEGEAEASPSPTESSGSSSPAAVDAGAGTGQPSDAASESPQEEASQETDESVSQEDSAREVLEEVIPQWASLDYENVGTDASQWVDSWAADEQTSKDFEQQSERNFVDLWGGVIALDVNASADSIKSADKVWEQEDLTGWHVTVERKLASIEDSGGVNVTETAEWEFSVEQQDDGSSTIV